MSQAPRLKHGLTNLRNQQVGHLLVLRKVPGTKGFRKTKWECKCTAPSCGKVIRVFHYRLVHSNPKTSCGCVNQGLPTQYNKEYHAWMDAKARCHNPAHHGYPEYGGRGIRVCDAWQEDFAGFLSHVGPAPSKQHSIDRIEANGHYEPGNVRWATAKEQGRNKRRTVKIPHPRTGEMVPAAQVAEELKVSYQTLRSRMINTGTWPTQGAQNGHRNIQGGNEEG